MAGVVFIQRRLRRYNISISMAHQRHNPSALHDPKVSIVIPVYNEKSTIDEILRRVVDTEVRKEVIIIDDCSTDGTRQILENMAASRTDLDSNRRSRQRSPSTSGASTKCRLVMRDALTKKAKRLPGKTASRRCGASSDINSPIKRRLSRCPHTRGGVSASTPKLTGLFLQVKNALLPNQACA